MTVQLAESEIGDPHWLQCRLEHDGDVAAALSIAAHAAVTRILRPATLCDPLGPQLPVLLLGSLSSSEACPSLSSLLAAGGLLATNRYP